MKVNFEIVSMFSGIGGKSSILNHHDVESDVIISAVFGPGTNALNIIIDGNGLIRVSSDVDHKIFIAPNEPGGRLKFAGESFIGVTIYNEDDNWFFYFTGGSNGETESTEAECIKPGWGITVVV